VITLLHPAHEP